MPTNLPPGTLTRPPTRPKGYPKHWPHEACGQPPQPSPAPKQAQVKFPGNPGSGPHPKSKNPAYTKPVLEKNYYAGNKK